MADLTIQNASFGMDSKGTEKYIKDLKSNVLEKAGKELKKNIADFQKKVETYWHGEAKDHFNKQIYDDAKKLQDKIEHLENQLEDAFQNAQKSLEKFDNNLKTNGIKF